MTTTAPGWYDDGHGAMRWWDGTRWTEHVAQPDAEMDPDAPTEAEIVQTSELAPPPPEGYALQPAVPGYPGPDAPGGAFGAATGPRKSKLWIVWLVLGIVLLGLVIGAAVLIPILLLNAASSDNERAAVAAVELYDDAWQNADCDAFLAATTESFRSVSGFVDCETFAADAALFADNFDDYEVSVDEVVTDGDQITVTTIESYNALVDENGQPTDPQPGATTYHYTVVSAEGGWAIDDVFYD